MIPRETYLITGTTSGLGLEAARAIACDPARRIVAGARDPSSAAALRAAVPPGQLILLPLDTASLDSVRRFGAAVKATLGTDALHGMACNAGLQVGGPTRRSADGHELTFATNHLGHFLLMHDLLDRLAPGAAVVSTASGTHDPADRNATRFGFRGGLFPSAEAVARGDLDPGASDAQATRDRYATSKLCGILLTYAMAARVPAETARFIAFDPGLMPGTGLARDFPLPQRLAWRHVLPLLRFVSAGVSTPARSGAALSALLTGAAQAQGTGLHVDFTLRGTPSSTDSHRVAWQDDLYQTSLRLCGIGIAEPARVQAA